MRTALLVLVVTCGLAQARPHHRPTRYRVQATAFCLHGTTAAGTVSHTGTVAADPDLFPIGTQLRVHGAGPYSGVYVVTDTGSRIRGHRIDLRLHTPREAKKFGRKMLWVRVIKWGEGPEALADAKTPYRPAASAPEKGRRNLP